MKRRFAGLTDPGLVRNVNQDSYYIDPEGRYFIVADGMGGHAGGQEASQIAIKEIQLHLDQHWSGSSATEILLAEAFNYANQGIIEDQNAHPERADMGTTGVIVAFRQDQVWCANVGDSRLYRLRDSDLEQITRDDTWIAQAIRTGDITPAQAKTHPWRHVLSKCLGRQDLTQIEVDSFEIQPGDRLLLCSDGLTEEVPDELISTLLNSDSSPEETVTQLVEEAKKAGGSDNITVVVVFED